MEPFILGWLCGLFVCGLVAWHIAASELAKSDVKWDQAVRRANNEARMHERENERLKEAIATAQQALAEVRPPRTEHKINY